MGHRPSKDIIIVDKVNTIMKPRKMSVVMTSRTELGMNFLPFPVIITHAVKQGTHVTKIIHSVFFLVFISTLRMVT